MLIINEQAEQKLSKVLASLRLDPGSTRYLYFSARDFNRKALKTAVFDSLRDIVHMKDTSVYMFEDGDICVLSRYLPYKDGKEIMVGVSNCLHQPITDRWVTFVDLNTGLNRLLLLLDQKLRKIQTCGANLREQQKENIEHNDSHIAADIKCRRDSRRTPRLMMIEDDLFSSKLVENALKKDFPITTLHSAAGALESYAECAPNVLFLDINLPDVKGYELIKPILNIDPEAYIIMLSGNADRDNVVKAMSMGAKGFVAKPFTCQKLLQYIERCPTLRTAPRELAYAHG